MKALDDIVKPEALCVASVDPDNASELAVSDVNPAVPANVSISVVLSTFVAATVELSYIAPAVDTESLLSVSMASKCVSMKHAWTTTPSPNNNQACL